MVAESHKTPPDQREFADARDLAAPALQIDGQQSPG